MLRIALIQPELLLRVLCEKAAAEQEFRVAENLAARERDLSRVLA